MSATYLEALRRLDELATRERSANARLDDEIRHLAVLSVRASVIEGTQIPRLDAAGAVRLATRLDAS